MHFSTQIRHLSRYKVRILDLVTVNKNMQNKMRSDVIGAGFIGFFMAILFLVIEYSTLTVIRPDEPPPIYYWLSLIIFPAGSSLGMFLVNDIRKKVSAKFSLIYEFYKFTLVGGMNIFIDTTIYNGLIVVNGLMLGNEVLAFKGIAFIVAVINSYFWNKKWTFSETNRGSVGQFSKFLVVSIIGLAISLGSIQIIITTISSIDNIHPLTSANIGQATAVVLSAAWNFIGYRYLIFKNARANKKFPE